MKIWRARVAHAPGVGPGEGQQRLQAQRGLGHAFFVGKKGQLGHAPRRLHSLHGFAEVQAGGGFAQHVHRGKTGQALGKRAKQQLFAFHGQEVFAVDPHHVHAATAEFAGSFFAAYAFDHLGGVADLDVFKRDAKPLLNLLAGPLHIGVDDGAAGPGIEVHGLAACLGFKGGPVRALCQHRAGQTGTAQGQGE